MDGGEDAPPHKGQQMGELQGGHLTAFFLSFLSFFCRCRQRDGS